MCLFAILLKTFYALSTILAKFASLQFLYHNNTTNLVCPLVFNNTTNLVCPLVLCAFPKIINILYLFIAHYMLKVIKFPLI